MKVQFLNPYLSKRDIDSVVKVLKSGWLVLGKISQDFEEKFAKYLGCKHAILTNSATNSIYLSLLGLGIKPGDEVITTALSYVATANPILYCGATPVFVDVEPDTGLLDIKKVEKAITPKTKAIIVVHLYGQMVDMIGLKKIIKNKKIVVIEDAAHAIEAKRDECQPGQLSDAACFSFHVAKNITAGQGGCIVTNSSKLYEFAKLARRDGVRNVGMNRYMEILGYKFLMTDFQAAMLGSQLKRIDKQRLKRKNIYKKYAKEFLKAGIKFPKTGASCKHAYHMFVIWVEPKKRDEIRVKLEKVGIQTSVHYNPIHLEPFYKKTFGYKPGDFPIAEKLGSSTITLPLHLFLTIKQQDYIIRNVIKICKA
jgi:UDP-4-amino-4-deoxy-L-arabinose-oxoglutarate aminotransferase